LTDVLQISVISGLSIKFSASQRSLVFAIEKWQVKKQCISGVNLVWNLGGRGSR